jgi:hypothetical protein
MAERIDLNSLPVIDDPGRWKYIDHSQGGIVPWDPLRIYVLPSVMLPSAGQISPGKAHINKNAILQDVRGFPVANANVLDFLYENPEERIGTRWAGNVLYFPGTILYESREAAFIPCLFEYEGKWHKSDKLLEEYEEDTLDLPQGIKPLMIVMYLGSHGIDGTNIVHESN